MPGDGSTSRGATKWKPSSIIWRGFMGLSRVVHIAMRVSADGHEVAADRVGSEDTGHTGAQAPPRVGAMVFQAMLAFEQPDERLDAVAHVAQEGPFGRVLLRRMAARGRGHDRTPGRVQVGPP